MTDIEKLKNYVDVLVDYGLEHNLQDKVIEVLFDLVENKNKIENADELIDKVLNFIKENYFEIREYIKSCDLLKLIKKKKYSEKVVYEVVDKLYETLKDINPNEIIGLLLYGIKEKDLRNKLLWTALNAFYLNKEKISDLTHITGCSRHMLKKLFGIIADKFCNSGTFNEYMDKIGVTKEGRETYKKVIKELADRFKIDYNCLDDENDIFDVFDIL